MSKKRHEVIDPTPVEWPLGISTPETLEQKIARMVRTSVSQHAAARGAETFDEADDFDVGDDEDFPESVHELDDDQERVSRDHAMMRRIPPELVARLNAAAQKAKAKPAPEAPTSDPTVAKDLRATVSGASKPEASDGKT